MNINTIHTARRRAAAIPMLLAALVMIIVSSCSDSTSGDARDLLSTVPSDAGAVAVFNVRQMLEKTGCKVADGKVTMPEQMARSIESIKDPGEREMLKAVMSGDAGLALEAAVFFYADQPYFTALLDDPVKARTFIEKHEKVKMQDTDGVALAGNFAIKGNQLWMSMQYEARPEVINGFEGLSEKQSYLSLDHAESLASTSHEINAIGDMAAMNRILATYGLVRRGDLNSLSMFTSTVLRNPAYITLSFNIVKKEGAHIQLGFLDGEGKPAKYLLPEGTIDASAVESLGGSAETVGALDVPARLIDKIREMASSFGGGLPAQIVGVLKPIDGTMAMAGSLEANSYRAVISTDGNETSELQSLLASIGDVKRDGKMLRLTVGETAPAPAAKSVIDVKEAAKLLKGSIFGVVTRPAGMKGLEQATVLVKPRSGSIVVEIGLKCDASLLGGF